jgi:hypothetical protein
VGAGGCFHHFAADHFARNAIGKMMKGKMIRQVDDRQISEDARSGIDPLVIPTHNLRSALFLESGFCDFKSDIRPTFQNARE